MTEKIKLCYNLLEIIENQEEMIKKQNELISKLVNENVVKEKLKEDEF